MEQVGTIQKTVVGENTAWYGIRQTMVWYLRGGIIWYGVVLCGVVIWGGVVWYSMG